MFSLNLRDALFYLFLYGAIPIAVGFATLNARYDNLSAAYCYMTLGISALNSIYDITNRWQSGKEPTIRNRNLAIMGLFSVIALIYCFYAAVYIFNSHDFEKLCDWFLISYLVSFMVALVDIVRCVTVSILWKSAD